MMETIAFFYLAFLTTALASGTLSLVGTHVIPRKQGLEILALSQLALMGNLISKLLFPNFDKGPILFAFLFFTVGKLFLAREKGFKGAREAFFVGLYVSFLALSYLLISYFPQLEAHMSVGFFGDIVTATRSDNLFLIFFFLISLSYLFLKRNTLNRETMEMAFFGKRPINIWSELIFSLIIVVSLYGLGLIFSLSYLLLPALFFGDVLGNQKRTVKVSFLVSSFAAVIGLMGSLSFTRLNTTPLQVIVLFLLIVSLRSLLKFKRPQEGV